MKNSGWNSTTKDRLIKKNSLIKIKNFFPFKQAFKQINTRLYEKTLVRKTLAQGGGLREKQLIKTWSVQRHAFNAGAASSRALSVQRWTGGKQEHSLIEKNESFSCAGSSLWLHQGFQTLGRTRDASWDRAVVVGGLKRSLVFLGADQTQDGFVEELVLILSVQKKKKNITHTPRNMLVVWP